MMVYAWSVANLHKNTGVLVPCTLGIPARMINVAGSPGADVWSTFSTSRDAAPAAPDAFGSDPFGGAPAPSAAGMDLFGGAAPSASRPSATSDPFAMGASDFGTSSFGASTTGNSAAASNGGTDPFGMSGLSATPSKAPTVAAATPPARPLPEDMFAAPASPAFGMGGFRPAQQQQPAPFGQMTPGYGAFGGVPGGFGGPQGGAFPARPQAGGPFGMPQQPGAFGGQGMQGAFGGQQAGFGGQQAGFGGQQAGFGGQQSAFGGASDPFGSDVGFGSSFAQVTVPTVHTIGACVVASWRLPLFCCLACCPRCVAVGPIVSSLEIGRCTFKLCLMSVCSGFSYSI